MALIKCKDCGKEVSDSVTSCPHCGNNIKKQLKDLSKAKFGEKMANFFAFIIMASIGIGIVWFIITVITEPESEESKRETAKYMECYNRSDSYFKCDWATLEDRCVCKLR